MRDILGFVCFLGIFGAFIAALGIYGGIEQDCISLESGIKGVIICIIVFALCTAWTCKMEKDEEENIYDRL